MSKWTQAATPDTLSAANQEIIDLMEDLLAYAQALQQNWQWKRDELGQFCPDYEALERSIAKTGQLLAVMHKLHQEALLLETWGRC